MVESSVRKKKVIQEKNVEVEMGEEGTFLEIGGTVLGSIGKIALAIGSVGLLMFLFVSLETLIGIGTLYTGVTAIGVGLIGMIFGNRLRNGFWLEGVLVA